MLIVSGTTTAIEVENWRKAFKNIGYTMCVFNVSLYHGASYKFPAFDICAQLPGRLVVILNNPFYRDDVISLLNTPFYPLDYLEQAEMFEAARRHNVRTYVVNYASAAAPVSAHHKDFLKYVIPMASFNPDKEAFNAASFDGRTEMYSHLREAGVGRDEMLPESYQYCRIKLFRMLFAPKEQDFDNRMQALADRLASTRPDRTYFAAKAYEPAVKGSSAKALLFKRYDCGHVEVRRGLDTTYAVLASTVVRRNQTTLPLVNEFVLLKLLPLRSKLNLFTSLSPQEHAHYQVSLAIISDIADEQNVFLNCVREQMVVWKDRKEQLGGWLTGLDTLQKFDFSDLCQIEGGADALKTMLLKLCHMASQYNKAHMIKSNFLAKALLDTCFVVMKSYLNVLTEESFKETIDTFITAQQLSKDDDLLFKMRDPHDCAHEVCFNHWIPVPNNALIASQKLNIPPTLNLMRPTLEDMSEQGAYSKAVAFFSQSPQYHIQPLPNLYAVPPDADLLSESACAKPSYFARGVMPCL